MTARAAGESAVRLSEPVREALAAGLAVVALESSVLAQGLPVPRNKEAARRMELAIRQSGATPAVTAVVRGTPTAGLTDEELARFLKRDGVAKASARDLPAAMFRGADAATTVAASLAICRAAGLTVFATGGIGGVHRGAPFDESADLIELARTPAVVVCAGAKAILDIAATFERLETLAVTVIGYRCDEFPAFYHAESGIAIPVRAEGVDEVAAIVAAHRRLALPGAVLVVQPPPAEAALGRAEVDAATSRALRELEEAGIRGAGTTPFLLAAVERATGGRSLDVNVALLEANARLAAEIAVALGATRPSS